MTDFEDKYYLMREICKYLGIGCGSALKWIANKGMPAHKVGKKWKFKLPEIDAWINSGQAEEF